MFLSVLAYVALTALIRTFGKRTISRMNPGDFVVTVAIGSVVATLILFEEVPVANAAAALASLVGMQFLVEWATARSTRLRAIVDGTPTLLVHNGVMLTHNLRRENVDEEDILKAVREHGSVNLADVKAVVLEIDGTFSVIGNRTELDETGLKDVPDTR